MHRYKYIDALRGIAIMMVILSHSHPYFAGITNYKLPLFFESFVQNGDQGVTLFFLMSAFTLCLSLNKKKDTETHPIRNYSLRRVFRIMPLYYFVIIIVLITGIKSTSPGSLLANIFFINGLSPLWTNSTVSGGWSVGIEVLFYLIFPFLFFRIKSVHFAITITLICMIIAKVVTSIMSSHILIPDHITWSVFTYENIISQFPVFLIGICLFRYQNQEYTNSNNIALNKTFLFLAILIIFHLLGGNVFKAHYLFAIAFAFLSFGLSHYPSVILVNRFTIWIGKLSYSIYLMHLLVTGFLSKFHFNHYCDNDLLDTIIRFFVIMSISVFISYITYNLIERPFIAIGKRIINKLGFTSG